MSGVVLALCFVASLSAPEAVRAQENKLGNALHEHSPQIWFCPQTYMPNQEKTFCKRGAADYMDLFIPQAPWEKAARHVQVFEFYGGSVLRETDAHLKQIVADLKRRNIAMVLETGALVTAENRNCPGQEGFGWEAVPSILQRIKGLGGTIQYIHLDVPAHFAVRDPHNCITPEEMARQLNANIQAAKAIFPNIIVDDIEHLIGANTAKDFEEWIEIYRKVNGSYLHVLVLDIDYKRPGWARETKELEDFAHSRGILFGILYQGGIWEASTDADFVRDLEKVVLQYEGAAGGHPDEVTFQSWSDVPHHALPETNPTAFTHAINDYFRTRTTLRVSRDGSSFSGVLTDASGRPLASAPIQLSVKPLAGPGKTAQYKMTGDIPVCASEAEMIFQANANCGGCRGENDVKVYGVNYHEEGGRQTAPADANFALPYKEWTPSTSSTVRREKSDEGPGTMLHLSVPPGKDAKVSFQPLFPVTTGDHYTLTLKAKISPVSAGNGNFGLIFYTTQPNMHIVAVPSLTFEPADIFTQAVTTDDAGRFSFNLDPSLADGTRISLLYSGNEKYWPAAHEETLK